MVKVNKQRLGYCVADWKGNYFLVEAERSVFTCAVFIWVYVCMCVWECVYVCVRVFVVSCSFRWGFLLAAGLAADLSVLVSLQGCEMTHHGAHLGPCNLFQLFPSHSCSLNMFYSFFHLHFFALLYIHAPHLIQSPLSLSLTHAGRISYVLSFLRRLNVSRLYPGCKASRRIT